MSRNGSGTYNLPAGNPVVTGNTISSSWANTTLSDIASALTGSIAADGQTTPTANLVMGTYAHTGVGNATARTMYASAGQVQDSVLTYLTSVAGPNAITASAPIVMTAYATGQVFRFIAAGASTGAVTININSIGLKSIVRTDGSALVSGDIASGAAVQIMYDGTNFQLLSDANGKSETVTNLTVTGNLTNSALTSGRVTFASTGGLLADSASLTFDGTTLTSTKFAGAFNGTVGATTPSTIAATTISASGVSTFSAGSAAAPALTTAGDTNTGIFFPAADTIAFAEGGSEVMRIDASGNVGIGTASPVVKLHVAGTGTQSALVQSTNGGTTNLRLLSSTAVEWLVENSTGGLKFIQDTTERMRLDSSGNLGLGVTPNTWSLGKAMEVNSGGNALWSAGPADIRLTAGAYYNGAYKYGNTGSNAAAYEIAGGTHVWRYAGGGTINNNITFTQAMTLDASGNLGIGNTTPSSFSVAADNLVVGTTSGDNGITIVSGTSSQGSVFFADGSATAPQQAAGYLIYVHGTDYMALGTANTERMRIDASGNLIVRGTTKYSSAITTITGGLAGTNQNLALVQTDNTSSHDKIFFVNTNGVVGKVTTSGSTTTYATSSDYRLKENIAPMTGALTTVAQLKPVTYNWKSDGSDGQGFIAHELAEVVPDCVIGEKDATHEEEYEISPAIPAVLDEEGNEVTPAVEAVMGTRTVPVYQGIDTSFLVATLTAAIQEQQAMIDELKAKVAALEAA